jgi:hypothetical protein
MQVIKSQKSKVIRTNNPESNGRTVKIFHQQEIKQSLNYQSAAVSYGIELTVEDSDFSIRKGMKRAERLVESELSVKFSKQKQLLTAMSK